MKHSTPKTMDKLLIYNPDGRLIAKPLISKAAVYKYALMGDHYIELPYEHTQRVDFPKGCYVRFHGMRFETKAATIPDTLQGKNGYRYMFKFYAQQHRMEDCRIKWLSGTVPELTFSLTTSIRSLAQLICDNMNAFLGADSDVGTWRVGVISEDLRDVTKTISFNGETAWDKLSEIANTFETEWWVIDAGRGEDYVDGDITLNFGKLQYGFEEKFIEGEIIKKVPTSKRGQDGEYGTRFYVFGGTQNLPEDYHSTEQGGTTNHVSEKRLHLPNNRPYIDAYENMAQRDVVEQYITLDNIFPKNTESITGVTEREVKVDGVTTIYYNIECGNTAFLPSMAQSSLGAVFTSGSLRGRKFGLNMNGAGDVSFNKSFEILTQTEGSGDSSVTIPNEYLKPSVGDTFILTGVTLPEEYVIAAEEELEKEALKIVAKRSGDTNVYECETDPVYCEKNSKNFILGQLVILMGVPFGDNGRKSRIQGFEKKLYNEYEAVYSIGDNRLYNWRSEINLDFDYLQSQNGRLEYLNRKSESKTNFGQAHLITEIDKTNNYLNENKGELDRIKLDITTIESTSTEAKKLAVQVNTTSQNNAHEILLIKKELGEIQLPEENTAPLYQRVATLEKKVSVGIVPIDDQPVLMRMSPMNRGMPEEEIVVVSNVDVEEDAIIIEETSVGNDVVVVDEAGDADDIVLVEDDEPIIIIDESTDVVVVEEIVEDPIIIEDSNETIVVLDTTNNDDTIIVVDENNDNIIITN